MTISGYDSSCFLQIAAYLFFFDTNILKPNIRGRLLSDPLVSPEPERIPFHLLPSNFSFLPLEKTKEGVQVLQLAGMARPTVKSQVDALVSYLDVGLICSFIEPRRAAPEEFYDQGPEFKHVSIPWSDLTSEVDLVAVDDALALASEIIGGGKTVCFHCYAGVGRTGTALALFLVRQRGFAPADAIALVRDSRPGSIETISQEELIVQFDHMKIKQTSRQRSGSQLDG